MNTKLVAFTVAAILALHAQPVLSASVQSRLLELLGTTAEPLLAVEANRAAIVNRLMAEHRATLFASGIPESSFRNALESLRADQLLAAALVDSFAEVTTIVDQSQRGVASAITPKDGPGSGANSWIGYTAGSNLATGAGSAVASGTFNAATTTNAAVFAGQSNVASGISSLVIGGFDNRATAIDSLIGAGAGHRATGARSVVVGGGYNLASGQWSFIGGGGRDGTASTPAGTDLKDHVASGIFSTIAGGQGNRATGPHSFVGGGLTNTASGFLSAVASGSGNVASNLFSSIGGGDSNTAGGLRSTVGGGTNGVASGEFSTVGGGFANTAGGDFSTVGGGANNDATSGDFSTVGGGSSNTASGVSSFVGGGSSNTASGYASTVGGGFDNTASGNYSVAMGRRARVLGNGAFAFADSNDFDFNSSTDNAFRVRATGGVRFVTGIDGNGATTWSCLATDGNGWGCSSDRNLKENLQELDGRAVLAKVTAMPIYQWQPKGKNAHVKHFGPMAQDFHAAFGLGDDDKMIGMQDADGVALAAIQGLNAKVEVQSLVIEQQARDLAEERAARQLQAREIAESRLQSAAEIAKLKLAVEVLLARTSRDAQVAVAR